MKEKLPEHARFAALAQRGAQLTSYLLVSDLSRLAKICRTRDARVAVTLEFGLEEGSELPTIDLDLDADLDVVCQRCLLPMVWRVAWRNRLVLVAAERQTQQLPDRADYVICKSEQIELRKLVEDELLLSLPQSPAHDSVDQCDSEMITYLDTRSKPAVFDNPFGALKNMRG